MLLPFMGEFAVARVAHRKERKFGLINRSGIFVVHPIYDRLSRWRLCLCKYGL